MAKPDTFPSTADTTRPRAAEIYFQSHCLDRIRVHHRNAGLRWARTLFEEAVEIEAGFMAAILQRPLERVQDRYFATVDLRGVFVVRRSRDGERSPWVALTYLRMGCWQQEHLAGWVGEG